MVRRTDGRRHKEHVERRAWGVERLSLTARRSTLYDNGLSIVRGQSSIFKAVTMSTVARATDDENGGRRRMESRRLGWQPRPRHSCGAV